MSLEAVTEKLIRDLQPLRFSDPITHVYNPLVYAGKSHRQYLARYGKGAKEVVLLGMNPGPFGMAQTGVPFGDVAMVRDWMGIEAPVGKPPNEHPKRPIEGFACARSEVSGTRLWGWARDRLGTPDRFFGRFFVINYCPLCFMEESGRNFTPDKLPRDEREAVNTICDGALRDMIALLEPRFVIGVGRFAEACATRALNGGSATIGRVLHPSPASPAANRGWADAADKAIRTLGIEL